MDGFISVLFLLFFQLTNLREYSKMSIVAYATVALATNAEGKT